MRERQPCAGGIVFDGQRRLLLIRRGQPPAQGSWSVPGGRCRPGESPRDACVRELAEETGLEVVVARHAGRVERPAPDGGTYVIDDFVCTLAGDAFSGATGDAYSGATGDATGAPPLPSPVRRPRPSPSLRAGDDAVDARWVTRAELHTLPLSPGLADTLAAWDLLPD